MLNIQFAQDQEEPRVAVSPGAVLTIGDAAPMTLITGITIPTIEIVGTGVMVGTRMTCIA